MRTRAGFMVGLAGVILMAGCSSTRHRTSQVSYREPAYMTPPTYTYAATNTTYRDTTPAYDRDSVVSEMQGYVPAPTATNPRTTTMRTVSMPEHSVVRHDITLDDFRRHVRDGSAVIVDARLPKDFRRGHVKGAINIPGGGENIHFTKFQKDASLDQLVIVYCGEPDCPMGENVATYLTNQGYTNVKVYKPGWQELSRTELVR